MDIIEGLGLEVEQTAKLTLLHPINGTPLRDKDGKEAWIELFSGDSPAARIYERTVLNRRLKAGNRVKMTAEEAESNRVDLLVQLTKGWNLVALDGRALDLPFSETNVRKIYESPSTAWLVEQVNDFIGARANF